MRLAGERSYVYISVRRNRDTHSSKHLYQILQRYRHIFQESISNITYVQTYTPRINIEYYLCIYIHSKNLCRILHIFKHAFQEQLFQESISNITHMCKHTFQESMSNITHIYAHAFQEQLFQESNITYVYTCTPRIYVKHYVCVNIHSENLCRILHIYIYTCISRTNIPRIEFDFLGRKKEKRNILSILSITRSTNVHEMSVCVCACAGASGSVLAKSARRRATR